MLLEQFSNFFITEDQWRRVGLNAGRQLRIFKKFLNTSYIVIYI